MSRELGAPEMVFGTGWPDANEETAELRWPDNLRVYDRMRRSDGQVRGGLAAINMPIMQTRWRLIGSRVRPEVMAFVQHELGLVEDERGQRRPRDGGVDFDKLLRLALLHLPMGFMAFEKWFNIGAPDVGVDPGIGPQVAHLAIGPRMPRSVEFIDVNPDGSLIGIRQWVRHAPRVSYPTTAVGVGATPPTAAASIAAGWVNASGFTAPGGDMALQPIPAANLVMFVNEQEGADWGGQSLLRSVYKNWLVKDFLIRVDSSSADRNGAGLPVVTYPAGMPAERSRALRIATAVRTGDEAGVALPDNFTLALLGVNGTIHKTLESIAYHDQAIGRGFLEMFLNLGHDAGLGSGQTASTFVDFFLLSIRAVLRYVEGVITEQLIRDLVSANFGPNEPYPALVADDPTAESTPTAEALLNLAASGLLIGDPGARAEIRRRYGMPPEDEQSVEIPFLLPRGVTDPAAGGVPTWAPGVDGMVLPGGDVFTPPGPGRPAPLLVTPPPGAPAPNTLPAPRGPAALPAGAATVDRKGVRLSAGVPVAVALAGGIVQGVVARVDGPHQVIVDVAGVPAAFTPTECQALAAATVPPVDPGLAGLLERTHALSERLAALAATAPGAVTYADPGYQPDGRKRYPLDTEAHVRAALGYIAQPDNRTPYTARQLVLISSRIRAAARRFNIEAPSLTS